MGKRPKGVTVYDNAEEVDEEVAVVPQKKKKKDKKDIAQEVEAEEVQEDEAPVESKKEKKAKKRRASEDATELAEAAEGEDADAPAKPKKKKKKQEEQVDEEDVEDAPVAKKEKKKRKASADDGSAADAGNEDDDSKQELTVFVGGIPFNCEEGVLRNDFAECGDISRLTMPLDNEGRPGGYAFITFKSKEAVTAALAFDGTDYGGRTLEVKRANKAKAAKVLAKTQKDEAAEDATPKQEFTVFVSGIPWSCEESALKKDFAECGKITKLNMPMNDQGKPRGIAFITFETKDAVQAALKFDGTEYGSRTLAVKMADKGGKGKGKDGKGKSKGKVEGFEVFVSGLPFETDEAILRKDFAECGEIVSMNMLKKEDGSCRGVAFVTYKTEEAVRKACEFNNTEYGSRWIQVEKSGERKGIDRKGDKGGKGKGKGKDKGKGKSGKGEAAQPAGTKQTFDESDDE
eukprot:TRINITY_DN1873_c0_g1_i1.p1 TRINITY_DN1873_c0_g1~~TRINITY_DN1873_c0_g1_i1.p1  ORF type:complete len:460 (-),score=143.66 TRINITY_DN1873_c0_g1_i1:354-1733(-)